MLVGILSDTHDRTDALTVALDRLRGRGAEHYVHCGDVGRQRVLDLLAGLPSTFVWGNNDWDVAALEDYAATLGLRCGGRSIQFDLGGKSFALIHGDNPALKRQILADQKVDYMLQGHTHVYHDERVGRVRVINPGALHRASPKSVALLDTATDRVERIIVSP